MANTDLTKQLWLWLAIKQANQQNQNEDYSYTYTNPSGNKSIAAGVPLPWTMNTWGGIVVNKPQTIEQIPVPLWVTATQSFAAPTTTSAPTSTTNWTVDTFSWITNKKKKNIAQTAGQVTPVAPPTEPIAPPPAIDMSGFREATAGQDVQFRQSYRDALEAPVETTPTTSPTWLTWAELQAYNQLSEAEQKTYNALATQGLKAQTDYLTKAKANMEFQKSQEETRLSMEQNDEAIAEIQSAKVIEDAQKSVANMKQNIGYLWTGGAPWVSSQKLDAVSNQVTLADRTLKNIIEVERLQKENRALGRESNAEVFSRQMKILQDDLDGKVNKTVQSALNQFNAAELEGKLDTIPEIEAFQQQLYAQLDGDLSSIMDTNIEARQFLIERYDKLAESQKTQMAEKAKQKAEYEKNANTLNKDMSNALGYFVNNNGEALVDETTGQRIVVPPETTTNYDASTGQMILMTKNRDGTIGVQLKQVWTGKNTSTYQKIGTNPDTGEDIYGFVNANAGTVTPYSVSWTGETIDRNTAIQKYGSTPAVRNFNPWNIMDTGFGGQKVEWERFTRFNTPQEWFNALVSKIQNIQAWNSNVYSPDMTLLEYISKYAPSSDNNNPKTYSGAIAKNLWISTWTKIKDIDATKLAMEHARHEDGNSFRMLQDLGITGKQASQQFNENKDATYKAYLETGKLPTGMKEWTTRGDNFINQATAWKTANPDYVTKDEKKDLAWIQNNVATDARRKDYLTLSSKSKTLTGIQERLANWTATPQDKQQLVNDFAKILDPTSVVREGEYALAGKYAQNKIDSMKQEISNYFSTNWPLSDDAAKMLAEWVARRHIAIKQANDEAIDEGLANAKYLLGRDIPPEGIGAKYSDINLKAKVTEAKKKLGWFSLSDILSKLP